MQIKNSPTKLTPNLLMLDNRTEKEISDKIHTKSSESSLKKAIKWQKIIFVLFLFNYIYVVFNQLLISIFNDTYSSMKKFIYDSENMQVLQNIIQNDSDDYFEKIMNKFIKDSFEMNNRFTVISNIRTTIRRVKLIFNDDPTFQMAKNNEWAIPYIDPHSDYNEKYESNEALTFYDENNLTVIKNFTYNNTFLNKGGYSFSYNFYDFFNGQTVKNNLTLMFENADEKLIDQIKSKKMTEFRNFMRVPDGCFSTIVIDFVLANYDLEYIFPVIIIMKLSDTGTATIQFDMNFLDRLIYTGTNKLILMGLEILLLVLFVIYIFILVIVNYYTAKVKYIKETRDKTKNNNTKILKSKKTLQLNKKLKKNKDENQLPNFFIFQFKIFFSKTINYLHISSIVITAICIAQWFLYISSIIKYYSQLNEIFLQSSYPIISNEIQNNIVISGGAMDNYIRLVSINFLLLFIRFSQYIVESIPETNIFYSALRYAANDLLSFFIFFLILFFALCLFTFLYFCKFYGYFNSFFLTIQHNMSYMLGIIDVNVAYDLFNISKLFTILYLLVIIIFIKYIVLKILLSILLYYYKLAIEEHNSNNRNVKLLYMSQAEREENKYKHFLNQLLIAYKNLILGICHILCCDKAKSKNVKTEAVAINLSNNQKNLAIQMKNLHYKEPIKDSARHERRDAGDFSRISVFLPQIKDFEYKSSLPKDFLEYNMSFSENYSLAKRKIYFESVKDEELLTEFYETKYRKTFIYIIFYFILLFIFVYNSIFNSLSPWRYLNRTAMFKHLDENPKYSEPNQRLFYINSTVSLRNYIFNNFRNIFEYEDEKVSLLGINSILFNGGMLTVRRAVVKKGYKFTDDVREFMFIDSNYYLKYENTTSFKYKDIEFNYTYKDSYNHLGGYTTFLDKSKYNIFNNNPDYKNKLIDDYTLLVFYEFFLDNLEYDIINYMLITCEMDYTGNYKTSLRIRLINLKLIHNFWDYPKLIFEIIFFLLVIFFTFNFFKDIVSSVRTYNKWVKDTVEKLSDKTKEYRHKTLPEIYRLIIYLLDYDRCAEFVVLFACYILMMSRIKMLSIEIKGISDNNFKYFKENNIDFVNFRDLAYNMIDDFQAYQITLSIIIIILSIRFTKIMALGKYFSILIETISASSKNNGVFICIIAMIQPGFVCYSNLAFGYNLKLFSTWGNSLIGCINVFFGDFNFHDYEESDPILGPIFFFSYLILMNMVLINFFNTIINESYRNVKDIVKSIEEKYDIKRVFCICCFKKKSILSEIILPIDSEFEFSKKLFMLGLHFKSSINSLSLSPREWADYEFSNVKSYNDALLHQTNHQRKILMAYLAKDIPTDKYIFDEALFKGAEEKHLKLSEFLSISLHLDIITNLESDLMKIENYKFHMHTFVNLANYQEKEKLLKESNDENYATIVELERKLLDAFKELKEIQELAESVECIDDDVRMEIARMEEEVKIKKIENAENFENKSHISPNSMVKSYLSDVVEEEKDDYVKEFNEIKGESEIRFKFRSRSTPVDISS